MTIKCGESQDFRKFISLLSAIFSGQGGILLVRLWHRVDNFSMAVKKITDPKKRAELIRMGNQLFNSGDVETAAQVFQATDYRDGLIRVGDHFYYEKHQPLRAYGYYRQAKHEKMLERVSSGFVFALKMWLWETPEEKAEREQNEKKKKRDGLDRKPHIGNDYITPTRNSSN